ncbi:efflux RND transporter periplasmic adaptor subunit [Sansalvadorimonas verongulae]|uniref:efflux RND transporter periplasmic adaptor subunit n=1 Tax=Sansalvadorimonas verongulae TaxID=2172824 RepID=UPI0012BC7E18|nr:efflux RND transporter periplasmic adaptor subunit [Sansalvadorimonas verongulae]MTI15006.1 efflux RND transporter periplasmic adaptor subunit [Sansalvadorimonas verongulae]
MNKVFQMLPLQLFLWAGSATAQTPDDMQLSCLLEPSREIKVSSHVSGIVSAVNTERGSQVNKGQVLVKLESGLEQAALDSVKARAEFSSRKLERNKDLLRKGLLSDFEQDELLTDKQLAQLAIKEAEARLKQRTIYSPADAIVVKRSVSIGEYVGTEPVLELVSLNPLHAEIVLRAEHYGQVQPGTPVSVAIGGQEDVFQGTVKIVDKVIDAASGTYGVRVELPNPDSKLPAGLKCRAIFELTSVQ